MLPAICHMSPVIWHLSSFIFIILPVTYHLSPVTCHLSLVTFHLYPVRFHLSFVTCTLLHHLFPVICLLSPVTRHLPWPLLPVFWHLQKQKKISWFFVCLSIGKHNRPVPFFLDFIAIIKLFMTLTISLSWPVRQNNCRKHSFHFLGKSNSGMWW